MTINKGWSTIAAALVVAAFPAFAGDNFFIAANSAEMNADTLLYAYDSGTPEQKAAVERTVLTAESAFREATSTIVLQRNERGLYCPESLSAPQLIEMIRQQVNQAGVGGKYPFEMFLLHALEIKFPAPCPARK